MVVFLLSCHFSPIFINLAGKMAKQTLVFESPKELSLKDNMIVIKDRDTEEMTLRSLEDIRLIMIDNHSVRISHTV